MRGLTALGGSFYMLAQFRRDRDPNTAWYASSDGTMERTDYTPHLWNGSLGDVVIDTGNLKVRSWDSTDKEIHVASR